jgi:polyphosphate glucokinase
VDVLVVDIGGTNVKMLAEGQAEPRKFGSGPDLGPAEMVAQVKEMVADWPHDVVAIGYPGKVGRNGPEAEPGNLAEGWVGFDFEEAFGKPVRLVNDAVLQALGAYEGGRMLFLGLGTGLGSALVTERVVIPLELGDLPYGARERMSDKVGKKGLERSGEQKWHVAVHKIVSSLKGAFLADYVVLGGGNAERVEPLPDGVRRGGNDDAFAGGFRLWEERVEPHDPPSSFAWRVVR